MAGSMAVNPFIREEGFAWPLPVEPFADLDPFEDPEPILNMAPFLSERSSWGGCAESFLTIDGATCFAECDRFT